MTEVPPLGRLTLHPEAARRLGHALLSNGFDEDALAEPRRLRALAAHPDGTLDWSQVADGDELLTALVELFVLGSTVEARRAEAALAPLAIPDALRAGFVERDADRISSPWEIAAYDGALLLGDHPSRRGEGNVDLVASDSSSSRTLAVVTQRASVEQTLDLGTGSGIQALLAARHSRHVLGVDLNARAVLIASVNAYLNGVENLESRVGDWFEPVAAERRFGLVVGNLPYLASPEVVFRFAHSGVVPNELNRRIVREATARLAEGGLAQLLMAWTRRIDEDPSDPVREMFEGVDHDALVLHLDTEDAATHAVQQCGWFARDPHRYAALLDRWLAYFRRTGCEAIDYGVLALRRPAPGASRLRRVVPARGPYKASAAHVGRIFAANDYLDSIAGDRELLAQSFSLPEGHRVLQSSRYLDGAYEADGAKVRLSPDVGLDGLLPPPAASVLLSIDGTEPLGETVARVARETGCEEAPLREATVAAVRALLGLGLVLPAGSPE